MVDYAGDGLTGLHLAAVNADDVIVLDLSLPGLFGRSSPTVVKTATVERAIWADHPPDSKAALRGHIHQLRNVIDKPFPTKLLKTVRGIGFRLADDDAL